ncbi:MAG: light-harvesting protein [Burkholderiaceae bacterium]|jgi:light-harvesting protein B-800-850 alpha chain|nr:light-harvesting protein [Burkholderiaceae bacterium]
MIYGKMWLVVKPSVGIPLFLSAVAISSFAVHAALLTNTTWVKRFLNGSAPVATASMDTTAAAPAAAAPTAAPVVARK